MKKESHLLRIGVLGAGPVSQSAHFDAVRKARNAELYAICDHASDLVERMAVEHEPRRVYTDYDAMLADPNVDAVIVATADQFHVPLCRKGLEAGKHILVEKPLGVSVEECEDLRKLALRTSLCFQVGNNKRFDPGVAFARQFVREELGDMISFKAWYYDSTLRYTMTDNLQPILSGSQNALKPEGSPKSDKRRYYLLTHGSHLVDTARFLAGDILAVQARLLDRAGAFCWFIDVEFSSGSLGHLDLHIPVRGDFEEGFSICGSSGSVKGRCYLPWFFKSSEVECFSAKDRLYRKPLGEDAHTYKLQVEGFAETILYGVTQHGANITDGTAAVRALVAMARSVEKNAWVRLDEVTGIV